MRDTFTVQDLPIEERPRERMVQAGPSNLSTHELLQIILGQGIPGESVSVTAQKILTTFGSLEKLEEISIKQLTNIRGIGLAKATKLLAAVEIGRRINNKGSKPMSQNLTDPAEVYRLVKAKLTNYTKEHFYLITLDSRRLMIEQTSVGTVNASLVHPREVFLTAIKNNATAVVLAHNHPSGDLNPSEADLDVTERLIKAGELLGIEVLDHVIVTKKGYFSFKEQGMLWN